MHCSYMHYGSQLYCVSPGGVYCSCTAAVLHQRWWRVLQLYYIQGCKCVVQLYRSCVMSALVVCAAAVLQLCCFRKPQCAEPCTVLPHLLAVLHVNEPIYC